MKIKQPSISVVYSYRDRSVDRLIKSVESIRQFRAAVNVKFIVVDYGSSQEYKLALNSICSTSEICVIRTETQGRPWSRAIAMNIGVIAAKTDIFISTDIDMVFDFDVISEVLASIQRKSKVHCRPYWLPPSGDKEKALLGDFEQLGGMMAMYVDDFISIGGFNEQIKFWGAEDTELNIRAGMFGVETKWLHENFRMYHVWHQVSHGFYDVRPIPSVIEDQTLIIRTIIGEYGLKEINSLKNGLILKPINRPLLKLLQCENNGFFECFSGPINYELINEIVLKLKSGKLVYLETGSRIRHDKFTKNKIGSLLAKILSKLNRILVYAGLFFGLWKNDGHDWIFLLINELDVLIEDYYWDFDNGCYFYPIGYKN